MMTKLGTCVFVLALLITSFSFGQQKYKGCPMKGRATNDNDKALNRSKNRYQIPSASDFDQSVTLTSLRNQGIDKNSFDTSKAAEITGFVDTVFKGSIENCNCDKPKLIDRDTHIIVVLHPGDPKTERVIVEVTPRLRKMMKAQGKDWTTMKLSQTIHKQWVKFKGWLFWDNEHWDASKLSNPTGSHIWRATAWEIHPITSMEIVSPP